MDDLISLQRNVSSEFENEKPIIVKIAVVIAMMARIAIRSLGRFYLTKLGIKG